jgi:hypothetical protein
MDERGRQALVEDRGGCRGGKGSPDLVDKTLQPVGERGHGGRDPKKWKVPTNSGQQRAASGIGVVTGVCRRIAFLDYLPRKIGEEGELARIWKGDTDLSSGPRQSGGEDPAGNELHPGFVGANENTPPGRASRRGVWNQTANRPARAALSRISRSSR